MCKWWCSLIVWEGVLIGQKEESTSTDMPLGTTIHNIEITLGKGGQLARAAGADGSELSNRIGKLKDLYKLYLSSPFCGKSFESYALTGSVVPTISRLMVRSKFYNGALK
ncbi:hypothetical protein F8388_013048 [Cannabis sativa]|uniref:Ribosomal protein L2 C-terminal domain-containing protein n=1 Tax=Cannabis sativa TaxID=3483 RepID=A0A7J6EBE3_CANSA|nr:hypothetical protein F8388_013048 [Cannabis sativa]KAF4393660.1 hypothetical protein G4B88_007646 [Cannabis sativa]